MQSSAVIAGGLEPALLKLIEVIDGENAILRENRSAFHGSFTDRKNQALRELMVVERTLETGSAPPGLAPILSRLSQTLKVNAGLLRRHITALGEVSDIIIGSMREAESDGTYSRTRGLDRR